MHAKAAGESLRRHGYGQWPGDTFGRCKRGEAQAQNEERGTRHFAGEIAGETPAIVCTPRAVLAGAVEKNKQTKKNDRQADAQSTQRKGGDDDGAGAFRSFRLSAHVQLF